MNFKKILALLLCMIMLAVPFVPLISAESLDEPDAEESTVDTETDIQENESNEKSNRLSEKSVIYHCEYDRESKKIRISGTVNHDVMIASDGFTIEVYRLAPEQSTESFLSEKNIKPLASTKIAIKFQFSIDVSDTSHRFSKYMIALRSPSGELFLTDSRYATVENTYTYKESYASYKGIQSLNPVTSASTDAGTVIIPVYMERLLSTVGHGYIYPINSTYRYFDEIYINELDKQIRTHSACGTRVYLQLLLTDYSMAYQKQPSASASFYMPDVYDKDVLAQVSAFAEFLSDRYGDYQSGKISGFILGTKVDKAKTNDRNQMSAEEYLQRYAFYLYVISASARAVNSSLDMIVPISSTYSYEKDEIQPKLSANDVFPSVLLEGILEFLKNQASASVPFNILLETSVLPTDMDTISQNTEGERIFEDVTVDNVSDFLSYLKTLSANYQNVPQHVMFSWSVSKQMSGMNLARAYVYSYAKLLKQAKISTFIVNFSADTTNGVNQFLEIERILSEIDTNVWKDSIQYLENSFAPILWQDILSTLQAKSRPNRTVYSSESVDPDKKSWAGSFSYFDFENGNLGDFMLGMGCVDIKSSYGIDSARTMEVTMSHTKQSIREEILCLYEYPEKLSHTPFLKIALAINPTDASVDSIYEVYVTIGDSSGTIRYEYLVQGYERHDLWLDLTEYNEEHVAEYIKISTRNLSDEEGTYSFSIYEIAGYNEEFSSDELAEKIEQDRLNIRHTAEIDSEKTDTYITMLVVFGILLGVSVAFLGMYLFFRRSMSKHQENGEAYHASDDSESKF